jgi:hypothetical protein
MTDTTHPKLVKLREKHAREEKQLIEEILVEKELPEAVRGFVKSSHHQSDGETWIKLSRHEEYSYRSDAPRAFSLREAVALAGDFKVRPVRVTRHGGCTHVGPDAPGDADEEKFNGVFPFSLRTDIHGGCDLIFWAEGRLRVNIALGRGLAHKLRDVRMDEHLANRGVSRVKSCTLLHVPGAQGLKWGIGGPNSEHPNEVQFFLQDVEAVLNHLEPVTP